MKIHHLEYTDGGSLDPDDVLADVVEDKDKVDDSKCSMLFSSTEPHVFPEILNKLRCQLLLKGTICLIFT